MDRERPSHFERGGRSINLQRGRPTYFARGRTSHYDHGGSSHYGSDKPNQYDHGRSSHYGSDKPNQYDHGRSSHYGSDKPNQYDHGRSSHYGSDKPNQYDHGRSSHYGSDKPNQYDHGRSGHYGSDKPNQYDHIRSYNHDSDKPNEHYQGRPNHYDLNQSNQYYPERPNKTDKGYFNNYTSGKPKESNENSLYNQERKQKSNIFDDECYIIKCKSYGNEAIQVPPPLSSMDDLSTICDDILYKNVFEKGYNQMTIVQKYSIPIIKNKMNLIASSQTGSGKTFSFLCPVISNLKKDNDTLRPHFPGAYACISPLGLVLCPTRELVIQIQNEINSLTKNMDLVCMAFYGGETMKDQIVRINERQADIIVSTPGRLLDLMNSCKVSLSFIKCLIFDEADEMISLGLKEQMDEIIFQKDLCPNDARQTILFTATLSDSLREELEKFVDTPYVFLNIMQKKEVQNSIKQIVKYIPEKSKLNELLRDVKTLQGQAIIFVELRTSINNIFIALKSKGYDVNYLHGKMNQARRQAVFEQFRNKEFQILIATSIAARGLDFPDLELVINYDLPAEFDQYMHRIGRTGRIGKMGLAINYFNSSNKKIIDKLIDHLKKYNQIIPQWLLKFT